MWKKIWEQKGMQADTIPLHQLDGFDMLSLDDYDLLVRETFGWTSFLNPETAVLELGCGAGAYLDSLQRQFSLRKVWGVDYSAGLIEKACLRGPTGEFLVHDITESEMQIFDNQVFDIVFSFGVLCYFSSIAQVDKALSNIYRYTKSKGKIYIGDIPDIEKKDFALNFRKESHKLQLKLVKETPEHLYLPKKYFEDFAQKNNCKLSILDGTQIKNLSAIYNNSLYRYHVHIEKS